jgi:hypothetical protein
VYIPGEHAASATALKTTIAVLFIVLMKVLLKVHPREEILVQRGERCGAATPKTFQYYVFAGSSGRSSQLSQ